jgi:hypothetical protein
MRDSYRSFPALIRKLTVSLALTALLFGGALVVLGVSPLEDELTMSALFVCAGASTLGLLIVDTPIRPGFGSVGFRRAASWVTGLSAVGLALTVFVVVASAPAV